jgi:hypothetical protein
MKIFTENLEKELNEMEYRIYLLVAFKSSIIVFPQGYACETLGFSSTQPQYSSYYTK